MKIKLLVFYIIIACAIAIWAIWHSRSFEDMPFYAFDFPAPSVQATRRQTGSKGKLPPPEATEMNPRDMPKGTRIWLYVRHSPGDNQGYEAQEAELLRFAHEKGWIVDRVFRDRWVSGKSTENRDNFDWMIHSARQKGHRSAEMIVVKDYSRFARNQDHAQFYLAELRMNGWKILSIKDDIPGGPLGRIFEALIHWKNEQFLNDLRFHTIGGLRYIAEQGCVPVGAICKGYSFTDVQLSVHRDGTPRNGRKPISDPEIAPLTQKAFEMKAQGAPHEAISKETGLYPPKSGSWEHFFSNTAYIGEYEFMGEVFTNIYPPIISRELFEAVQSRIPRRTEHKLSGGRKHHPRRKGSTFFLANIAVCAYCGSPMEGKSVGSYRYYVCRKHNESVEQCPASVLVPANEIEETTLAALHQHVLTPSYLGDLLTWTNEQLNNGLEDLTLLLNKTRQELAEAERLVEKYAANFGMLKQPSPSAEKLLHDQDTLVAHLQFQYAEQLQQYENSRLETTPRQIEDYLGRAHTMIDGTDYFDLRELCEQLCSRIVMSQDECRIELHFPEIQ